MKEYTDEYLKHIADIIDRDDKDLARQELASLHPADIAELYQNLDLPQAEYLFKLLDEDTAADVLMELDEEDRLKLIESMPAEDIAKQIDHLDTDD
ncbi:MAG: magnesium transporter, partial [Muribaculaceae bacterium]|nr:magnesium transporter [Muribaculaceae bacterium]